MGTFVAGPHRKCRSARNSNCRRTTYRERLDGINDDPPVLRALNQQLARKQTLVDIRELSPALGALLKFYRFRESFEVKHLLDLTSRFVLPHFMRTEREEVGNQVPSQKKRGGTLKGTSSN